MPTPTNVTKMKQPRTDKAQEPQNNVRPIRGAPLADPNDLSEGAIAQRAYEKFLARGGDHGQHEADWASAELELRAEMASADLGATQGIP